MIRIAIATALAAASLVPAASASEAEIARGKYLVTTNGCNDCHTPGYFFGKPDPQRYLGGSDVGFEIPGVGVFYGPNLTPDDATGLGTWSTDEIIAAIEAGVRPDGRQLVPIMPSHAFAAFTDEDIAAIAAYLQSLPPVSNKVAGPFGPGETVTGFMFRIMPPGAVAAGAP